MKIKRHFASLVIVLSTLSIHAQGAPVVDITHILETIYNGYQIYQQLQNTIQQLEYQYTQTKAQLQNLAAFDYGSIDSFTDAVSFADRNLSFLRNTEDMLKNMRITIGNGSYDLLSVYKIPGGVFDEMTDLWMREMSEDEKARAWSHYGLDPRNYFYAQTWKSRITNGAQKLAALAGSVENQIEENSKEVEEIVKKSRETESTVGLLQGTIELLRKLYGELSMLSLNVNLTGNIIADQAMASQYIPPETQISDDFFKKYDIPDLKVKGDRD